MQRGRAGRSIDAGGYRLRHRLRSGLIGLGRGLTLLHAMVHDAESGVRDEARLALEQLEQPEVLERLQTLVDEGLLS